MAALFLTTPERSTEMAADASIYGQIQQFQPVNRLAQLTQAQRRTLLMAILREPVGGGE